jgi:hypothetical protein
VRILRERGELLDKEGNKNSRGIGEQREQRGTSGEGEVGSGEEGTTRQYLVPTYLHFFDWIPFSDFL